MEMEISLWQIVLLTLYSVLTIYDNLNLKLELGKPLMAGCFAGIVMGDMTTGLAVGATLQLLILGVGSFGGASIPDYATAALIATPLAIITGQDMQFAIGLGVPIGLLMTQLDILARFSNVFLMKRAEKAWEREEYDKINMYTHLGMVNWGISRGLPVFLALYFGVDFVTMILSYSPEWLLNGLKVAGGLLPAVGISILLKYLPVKKFISFLIIGFVLAAYLKLPMLGIALLGIAMSFISYQNSVKETVTVPAGNATIGDDEDE